MWLTLGQRRRRWANVNQTMGEHLILLGNLHHIKVKAGIAHRWRHDVSQPYIDMSNAGQTFDLCRLYPSESMY